MSLIKASKVSKTYEHTKALNAVSFEVGKGQIIGLLGPNGAGKTTLLKSILGLTACSGELSVMGKSPRKNRVALMNEMCFIADVAILPRWLKVRHGNLISDIYRQWRLALDDSMPRDAHQLTRMQWQLIGKLYCRGPVLTQQELAHHLIIDHAQLTRLLRQLEDKGIIRKTTDQHDRRIKHIELLNPEADYIQRMMQCHHAIANRALGSIHHNEQASLLTMLENIKKAIA